VVEIQQKSEQRCLWLAQHNKLSVVVVPVVLGGDSDDNGEGDGVVVDVVTSRLY
jgi:hypothetical protein